MQPLSRALLPATMTNTKTFSVLVLQEPAGNKLHWVAQCLEYDMVTQAETIEELRDKFARLVTTNVLLALERGLEPLSNFKPAPQMYWQKFIAGLMVGNPFPLAVPGDRIPKPLREGFDRIPRGEATLKLAPGI